MNYAAISNKDSIIEGLDAAVDEVNTYVFGLSKDAFEYAPPGKWNAGLQLDHLIRSMKPLNLAYSLPVLVLKWKFGLANRPSKTYSSLVEKYESRLAAGGKAVGRFIPSPVPFEMKENLCVQYRQEKEKLKKKIKNYDELRLDKYILPHPLLGKLTMREMLFFTIHHNRHHLSLMKKYSEG